MASYRYGPCIGSSPRTWGTRRRKVGRQPEFAVHPHARGNTHRADDSAWRAAVHPHARGEHLSPSPPVQSTTGSSPRTWGTPPGVAQDVDHQRFIPTHVGNTGPLRQRDIGEEVHPHARGEHGPALKAKVNPAGSSPRTWGTRLPLFVGKLLRRFIPTHVGNTSGSPSRSWRSSVHPHARGEHLSDPAALGESGGSSPRTWGTLRRNHHGNHHTRFIPTHVGNTASAVRVRSRAAVHPHARGEHSEVVRQSDAIGGSSPRTWGTRARRPCSTIPLRFIPTHVGNTYRGSWPARR